MTSAHDLLAAAVAAPSDPAAVLPLAEWLAGTPAHATRSTDHLLVSVMACWVGEQWHCELSGPGRETIVECWLGQRHRTRPPARPTAPACAAWLAAVLPLVDGSAVHHHEEGKLVA